MLTGLKYFMEAHVAKDTNIAVTIYGRRFAVFRKEK